MQEVTFDLQTITPLFLAGADQTTAELRAPSFRGEMRYWLRALVGGMVRTGPEGLKTVRDAETEVFGATDRGSAISIKVSAGPNEPKPFTEQISIRVGGQRQATGKGYLLWSMRLKQPPRYYITPNTQFQIHLSTRGTDIIRHKKGIAALWLLTHLGGIGSRSRRCAGSLSIKIKEGTAYDFPFDIPADTETLKKQIEQGIAIARSLYSSTPGQATPAAFDAISQKTCRIWILQHQRPWNTPEEAMQAIGESLQSYRSTVPLNDRGVFGFPLKGVRGVERRASPLLLRVAELQGNKYVGIAVLFKTRYDDIPMRNYGIIEAWTNEFRGKKEVPL